MPPLSRETEPTAERVGLPLLRKTIAVLAGSLLLVAASCGSDKPSSGPSDTQGSQSSISGNSSTSTSPPLEGPPITEVPSSMPTVPSDGLPVPTTSPEQGAPMSVDMVEFRLREIFARQEGVEQLQSLRLTAIVSDGSGHYSVVDGIGGVRYDTDEWSDGTVFTDWENPDDNEIALIVSAGGNTFAVTGRSALVDPASGDAGVVEILLPRVGSDEITMEGQPTFSDLGTSDTFQAARSQALFVPDMYGDTIEPGSFANVLTP